MLAIKSAQEAQYRIFLVLFHEVPFPFKRMKSTNLKALSSSVVQIRLPTLRRRFVGFCCGVVPLGEPLTRFVAIPRLHKETELFTSGLTHALDRLGLPHA